MRIVVDVIKQILTLAYEGLTDLYFVDESGFSLTPNLSYAWQPIGEQWGIKSIKKKVQNVLGFLNPLNNHLKVYQLPQNEYMNSKLFIQKMNDFVDQIKRETVVVLDRAPWHTSEATLRMINQWESKGLYIIFLPAYSPHYNLIETLWRKIKYEWLNIRDFRSKNTLKKKLKQIFMEYGNLYNINFSMDIFK